MRIKILTDDSAFVLPYIERELPDDEIVTGGDADRTVRITQSAGCPDDAPVTLYCPNIVGTGMTGLPMELARAVAAGRLYHVRGNEARLSTVHAVDVARAVALALDAPGMYTVTDLCDPTYRDFTEALAHRINQRRIYTLPRRWARLLMGRRLMEVTGTDSLADGTEFARRFDFSPVSVTEYLTTHVYDDESL